MNITLECVQDGLVASAVGHELVWVLVSTLLFTGSVIQSFKEPLSASEFFHLWSGNNNTFSISVFCF